MRIHDPYKALTLYKPKTTLIDINDLFCDLHPQQKLSLKHLLPSQAINFETSIRVPYLDGEELGYVLILIKYPIFVFTQYGLNIVGYHICKTLGDKYALSEVKDINPIDATANCLDELYNIFTRLVKLGNIDFKYPFAVRTGAGMEDEVLAPLILQYSDVKLIPSSNQIPRVPPASRYPIISFMCEKVGSTSDPVMKDYKNHMPTIQVRDNTGSYRKTGSCGMEFEVDPECTIDTIGNCGIEKVYEQIFQN
jgi:hypothetical protein